MGAVLILKNIHSPEKRKQFIYSLAMFYPLPPI